MPCGLGTPPRGAISLGTVTADFEHSIFFGQPVVDAYLLDETRRDMESSSIRLWRRVHRSQPTASRPIGHDEVSLTLQHEVPSKSVGAARMPAINWPALCGDMEQAEELVGHLRSDSQKLDTYYESTRECARISRGRRIITAADAGRAMRLPARRHAPAQVPSIRRSDWR